MQQQLPAAIAGLLEPSERPRASIVLATDPAEPTGQRNRARYRDLLRVAEQQAGVDGVSAQALTPAYDLLENTPFWCHLNRGLAVYVAEGRQDAYRLAYPVAERVTIGAQFLITPLVPLIAESREFFILTLGPGGARLLRATGDGVEEAPLPSTVPTDPALVRGDDACEAESRYGVGVRRTRGQSGTNCFGHAAGSTGRAALHRCCESIDRALLGVADIAAAPLVLAGDEACIAGYRAITTHPQVLGTAVIGDPDRLSDAALQQRAWPLIAAELQRERERSVDRYRRLIGTDLVSVDPAEIVASAHGGHVDTLLLCPSEVRWGTSIPATGELLLHAARIPGDEDVANLAAVGTLRHGGLVHLVDRAHCPGTASFTAIFRG